jgi:hypothetical protein
MSGKIDQESIAKGSPKTPKTGALEGKGNSGKTVQKDGRPISQGISILTYNEMARAYFEEQSAYHVATTCKVSWRTAQKYIEFGDPERNMPPIRKRLEESQRQIQAKQDRDWQKANIESKEIIRAEKALMTKVLNHLARDQQALEVFLKRSGRDAKSIAEAVSRVLRDESFVFGKNDEQVSSGTSSSDGFEFWTNGELINFALTGKKPDRISVAPQEISNDGE